MVNKRKIIVSATKGKAKDTLLYKSVNSRIINSNNLFIIENNKDSLASVYNKFITPEYKDSIVIFVHDDVNLSDAFLFEKADEAITRYDVFGIAGGSGSITIKPNIPALWHLISEKKVGFAGHYAEGADGSNHMADCWMTSFGPSPCNASLLDGLFIGVNMEKVLESGVKFDEHCPAKFHFYDLLFSVKCKQAGLRVGVVPITVYHMSHGLTNMDQDFINGNEYFTKYCAGVKCN